MASTIQGRLRLPAHIRLSVIALVGMVGLVWLLFFGMGPRLHRTADRAGGLAPAAGTSGTPSSPANLSPQLAHLAATSPHRRVQVIIQLRPGVDAGAGRALVRSLGGTPGLDLHIINGLSAQMTAAAARTLAAGPKVHAVSLNATLKQTWWRGTPTPWQLSTTYDQSVHATGLWRQSTGRGVGVAVIDTGIAGDLPDFRRSRWTTSRVDRLGGHRPERRRPPTDTYGHGTHVAGHHRRRRPRPRRRRPARRPLRRHRPRREPDLDQGRRRRRPRHHPRRDLRPPVRRRPQGRLQHPRHQPVASGPRTPSPTRPTRWTPPPRRPGSTASSSSPPPATSAPPPTRSATRRATTRT